MIRHPPRPCRSLILLLSLALFACHGPRPAAGALEMGGSERSLSAQVEAAIRRRDPRLHVGVAVSSASTGARLLALGDSQRFTPASVFKVYTAAAALYYLGPQHRFVTELLTDGLDRSGRAAHHLYLRGSGDPDLGGGDLAALAARLRQQGVSQVTGDIIVDDGVFDATPWGRGWMWDDLDDGYSAPVSGINVNGNALGLFVLPGARQDLPARVFTVPAAPYVILNNTATTAAAGGGGGVRIAVDGPAAALGLAAGQRVDVTGSLGLDAGPVSRQFAVRDPILFAATVLRDELRRQRIEVAGTVRRAPVPPAALRLASHASAPLSAQLIAFMKSSDNHGMECLLKRLGVPIVVPGSAPAPTPTEVGSWDRGLSAIRTFLVQQVGLSGTDLQLSDGSGLSRYNVTTPAQLLTLMLYMQRQFGIGPEFLAALPLGGVDGTLAGRFSGPRLHARVRAKTGSLSGVSNLAGFLSTADGELLAFAIMMDGFAGSAEPYRRLQEEILALVAQSRGD